MLARINRIRRRVMRGITGNIGVSRIDAKPGVHVAMRHILISRPNHRLGNLLLITPLLQEINNTFPDCKIDLFVKGGLAPILFENYKNIGRIITLPRKPFKELLKYMKVWVNLKRYRYDMVINLDEGSSSGRLSTRFVTARNKIFGEHIEELALKHNDYKHMAKNPVYKFRYFLEMLGFKDKGLPVPLLDIKLSSVELSEGRKLLNGFALHGKKAISVFTYATGSKCYDEEWWASYYEKLVAAFPDYTIIEILPVENISMIGFKAPSFYSKDVREIAAVIANTSAFIGADSGIMHLAASSQTPVMGLFSVTDPQKYMPYGNNSIAIDTNNCSTEDSLVILKDILRKGQPTVLQYA